MIKTEIQIRFSDIDMLGHVNNGVLQQYYDIGKSSYLQDIVGVDPRWRSDGFIIASIETQFFEEIVFDSNIHITTKISEIGCKSVVFYQEIVDNNTQSVKGSCRSILVAFDTKNRVSIEIPEPWRAKIISDNIDIVIK